MLIFIAGDLSDPGDKIFRVVICAVSCVPIKPGIHSTIQTLLIERLAPSMMLPGIFDKPLIDNQDGNYG